MSKTDKERAKKYSIIPYLLVMLITVVIIVLLSYFAQHRNYDQSAEQYDSEQSYQLEKVEQS